MTIPTVVTRKRCGQDRPNWPPRASDFNFVYDPFFSLGLGVFAMKSILNFVRNDEGAALAEYGLLIALIAVVCITAVTLLGTNIAAYLTTAAASF
jgi:pilus assembly protein Flp/PilA